MLGAFLLLILVAVPLFIGGSFNFATVATAVLLALLIFAFSIFRYYPAADLTGYVPPAPTTAQQGAASQAAATSPALQPQPAPRNLLSMFPAKAHENRQQEKSRGQKPAVKKGEKKK